MRLLIWSALALVVVVSIIVVGAVRAQEAVDVVIGEAVGQPGDIVTLDITIDSKGQPVFGFHIQLAFAAATLPDARGMAGAMALPEGWILTTNLAGPGDLRFLALDLEGVGAPLTGKILRAEFTISDAATIGSTFIGTSLVTISNADGTPLSINLTLGHVIVTGCGDLVPDGVVDVGDVITLLQIIVGMVEPTPLQLVLGDVTEDGVLDIGDGIQIIRSVVGLATLGRCGP